MLSWRLHSSGGELFSIFLFMSSLHNIHSIITITLFGSPGFFAFYKRITYSDFCAGFQVSETRERFPGSGDYAQLSLACGNILSQSVLLTYELNNKVYAMQAT